jgi:nitroimidazol reductase NimA-like FMN-containing flavoprotein (pyridoxamine 5'-phosphate oxidase superfamily)
VSTWSQEAITAFLQQMHIPLRLASVTRTGCPQVVSLWYLYDNGRLYCATPQTAKIVTQLQREPRCGFEIAADQPPYRGVRGHGRAHLVPSRGAEILTRLLDRYLGGTSSSLAQSLLARSAQEVAIEITPVSFSTWDFTARMHDAIPTA